MTVPYTFATDTGTIPLAHLDANFSSVANNVATADTVVASAQPNITSVGTLTALTVTGAVSGSQFVGSGNTLTNIQGANVVGAVATATNSTQANYANTANAVAGSNVSGQVANAAIAGTVYTAAQPNITSVGLLTRVSSSGNIITTANVNGGNVNSSGNISATGNISGGNLVTTGAVNLGGWSVTPVGTKLYFSYGASQVGSLDNGGNFVVTGNITAFGTP